MKKGTKSLSDYMEDAQTKAFEKFGAFFAFSNKQFDEKKIDGVDYVSLDMGLICPKNNAKELMKTLDAIYHTAVNQDVAENGNIKIIQREYFNHETQLSSDTSDLKDAIIGHIQLYPHLFTEQIIQTVARDCFQLAVKNDWF